METSEEDSNTNLSVLLQFAKFSKGFKVSDFDDFLKNYIGLENLDFFGRLAYPNQWQMRLTDEKKREDLIRTGKTRIKNRSCWMYPLNPQEIRGFVHWLPNSVSNDRLKEQLQSYGEVLHIENDVQEIREGSVQSDVRYYALMLPSGTIKEDLPHFLKINGFLCLVVVRGRQPACFHCKEVGHRRAECPSYKAKLNSFCNREPKSATPRLSKRGKRHRNVEDEVEDKSNGDKALSIDDLAGETHFHTKTAATFSETRNKTSILEVIQRAQRDVKKNLQLIFRNFETDISQIVTKRGLSNYSEDQEKTMENGAILKTSGEVGNEELENNTKMINVQEETVAPVETPVENSYVNGDIWLTTEADTQNAFQPIADLEEDSSETEERISKNSEEAEKCVPSSESTTERSDGNREAVSSVFLISKDKQESVAETSKNISKLQEFKKITEAGDSAADLDSNSNKDDLENFPKTVERAHKNIVDYIENTFQAVHENHSNMASQTKDEVIGMDTKLVTQQILEKAKGNVLKTLQETVKGVKEASKTATETIVTKIQDPTDQSKLLLEIAKTASSPSTELLKEDTNEDFSKDMKFVKSGDDKSPEETIQTHPDPIEIVQDHSKLIKIGECSQDMNATTTENSVHDREGMESSVSKDFRDYIDELQTHMEKILDLVQDNNELPAETKDTLKRIQSKVLGLVHEVEGKFKKQQ